MSNVTSRLVLACTVVFSFCIFVGVARADTVVHFDYGGAVQGGYDVQVFSGSTPITAKNFLRYVNAGLYDNTIIHRDDYNTIMEGGGFKLDDLTNNVAWPTHSPLNQVQTFDPIVNEPGQSNVRGTIAMEKTSDLPDSATSQWYINVGDNSATRDTQNGGYTVFGKILGDGMMFVDEIDHANMNISSYDILPYYPEYTDLTSVPLYITEDNRYLFISVSTAAIVPAGWITGNSTADWGDKANWDGVYNNVCVPDGAASQVVLSNPASTTMTVDMASAGRTVGMINLSGGSIEISSSGHRALTLDNIDQPAQIDVTGDHTISAPVILPGNMDVIGAGTLIISAPVTLTGDVNLNITNTLTLSGGISGTHALKVASGTLNATSIQVDSLTIDEPVVVVPPIEWKGGDSTDPADWSLAGNWVTTGSAPSGAGCKVAFGSQAAENNTVDLKTSGQTVGSMSFAEGTSTTIFSSGQYALTLDNSGQPTEIVVAGDHTISAPVLLDGDANISGPGTLTLSGGVSGTTHALTFAGNVLNVSSIQVDTLNIADSVSVAAVPEPSTAALFCVGFAGLFVFGWCRRTKR